MVGRSQDRTYCTETHAMNAMTPQERSALNESPQQSASAILGPCVINAPGFGSARWVLNWEKHDGHLLPLVQFAGGKQAALYCVPEGAGGRWRKVYR